MRVWAPACRRVEFVIDGGGEPSELARDGDGYFEGDGAGRAPPARATGSVSTASALRPDPVSRFQPDGPHGPSAIVDPHRSRGPTARWRGVSRVGQVLYEMHVGTFTPEGTWAAAARAAAGARATSASPSSR